MPTNISNNKLVLKNTVYLYIRMLLTMAVSLYTSRVVLDVLGASDYGIFNVVAGIIVLISMLNNSMSAATQRFITFELGQQNEKKVSDTFCMSMTAHFIICIIILILGETIGLYYVDNYLNVPSERHEAALWVYQISLITIMVNIIRIPYNATVIAYERMSFYAWISILETVLRLIIVFILTVVNFDKLIFYSFLILVTAVVCTLTYKIYCQRKFSTCHYYWVMDILYFKKLMGFFGWNFVGSVATTGTHQVGNLILNGFCGTIANAAYGVATQVNSAICGFTNNFQMAYTPQIVKLYSQNRKEELFQLMNRSALLSYYLLFILAMPLFLNIDIVLGIWLKEVPPFAGIFCQWLIIYNLIDSVQAPLWKVITATGNIRNYEIWLNLVLILNIPLSFICLKLGMVPYIVVIISTGLNLLTAILRVIHVKIQVSYPISIYTKEVVLRVLAVSGIYLLLWHVSTIFYKIDGLLSFIIFFGLSVIVNILIIYLVGLNAKDQKLLRKLLSEKLLQKG